MCATLLLALRFTHGAVIERIEGSNHSELSHLSVGGGAHIYLSGAGLGSAFAPPIILIGNAGAVCEVQPFTSSSNRLHCVVQAALLPAPVAVPQRLLPKPPSPPPPPPGTCESWCADHHSPWTMRCSWAACAACSLCASIASPEAEGYEEVESDFANLPLRVFVDGRAAACWHVGGLNHGCFVRFDLAGTPRLTRVLTPLLQQGGLLRVAGHGIDGGLGGDGLGGDMTVIGRLFSGPGAAAVGQCGEKDCQAATGGLATVGCKERHSDSSSAVAYADANNFGCRLQALSSGQVKPRGLGLGKRVGWQDSDGCNRPRLGWGVLTVPGA